ncbi:MAG: TlpA family protein disulfide reductase [Candidatus Bipolaricaulota bacterium]|nr:TlpA family protein disulfide reductase [Candidatus Bipolaricaulota bacterium]MCS7274734.1 TlpA family protein disulfide reductase [Candidatus Bipolaricaulota bacterium]MDW8110013.1 TlpA disulfide reductase family protein [Candidatus Bipolaricaulota bacterium]MDW8328915.1 TlpA disulfide reductase family protein [Candidatus Bipolaricaulota bacterium]
MLRRLLIGMLIVIGMGWASLITYLYFFYDAGLQAPGALRREDQINEFVLRFNQGTFLDKNAQVRRDAEGPYLGFRAPDFELADLDGNYVRLSDLVGRPILLNFWASWCPPCRKEMPDLQAFAHEHGDKIAVVGVNWNDTRDEVERFLNEYGVSYLNLLDTNGKVFVRYGLTGLPTTFFIDEEGIIRGKWLGSLTKADIISAFQKTTRAFDETSRSP